MRRRAALVIAVLAVALLAVSGMWMALRSSRATHAPRTPALPADKPGASAVVPTPPEAADPYVLLSQEAMLETIDALASIQPYSGWRNSATTGEAEALDYVDQALEGFGYLAGLGLEQERQSFEVPLATEQWGAALQLTLEGKRVQVPASGLRGSRTDADLARSFDSDGVLGDSERNPVVVEGLVTRIRSAEEVDTIPPKGFLGRVVLLDYTVIDPVVCGGMDQAVENAQELLARSPAGLVLVTQFYNEMGKSHGSFAGDGGALNRVEAGSLPPVVLVRLEDMAAAGIGSWGELERVESATLRWDADVLSPGLSGNLVARIPGRDPSKAVILGAHIDSVNTPGAMDDAGGSAILLEIARALDAAEVQPPTDLYLAWFGSEELGLLGSAYFVNTHPEVLSRTAAMLQIDCLTHPLEGIDARLALVTWSGSPLGEERLAWPTYLAQVARLRGVTVAMEDVSEVFSDNHCFGQASVPNADLVFMNIEAMDATGSLHYAAHIHDPYDTPELAREEADALEQMARVAMAAALEPLP